MRFKAVFIVFMSLLLLVSCGAKKAKWDVNKHNWGPWFTAAYNGDISGLEKLIKTTKVDELNENGYTALQIAIRTQQYDSVEFLLDNGADINQRDEEQLTPLSLACGYEDSRIVNLFIKRGSNIDDDNGYGWTPLKLAASFGSLEILEILLEHGANVNYQKNGTRYTVLACAIGIGDVDKVKLLIDYGADISGDKKDTYLSLNDEYNSNNVEIFNKIKDLLILEDT